MVGWSLVIIPALYADYCASNFSGAASGAANEQKRVTGSSRTVYTSPSSSGAPWQSAQSGLLGSQPAHDPLHIARIEFLRITTMDVFPAMCPVAAWLLGL